jgi:hypothetical protein
LEKLDEVDGSVLNQLLRVQLKTQLITHTDEERELVPRMVELMGMHHGYIQQQV